MSGKHESYSSHTLEDQHGSPTKRLSSSPGIGAGGSLPGYV